MSEINRMNEINRVKKLEEEVLSIKVNYISTIIILLGYLFLKGSGNYELFGFIITENEAIIIFSTLVVIYFIRDFIKYTKLITKKILLGVK